MEKKRLVRQGLTLVSAASAGVLSHHVASGADAYEVNAGDQVMNGAQRDNTGATFSLSGLDEAGANYGSCSRSGTNSVSVTMTTQAGSGYLKAFIACQSGSSTLNYYSSGYVDSNNESLTVTCPSGFSRQTFGCGVMTVAPLDPTDAISIVKNATAHTSVPAHLSNYFHQYLINDGMVSGDIWQDTHKNLIPQPACW